MKNIDSHNRMSRRDALKFMSLLGGGAVFSSEALAATEARASLNTNAKVLIIGGGVQV